MKRAYVFPLVIFAIASIAGCGPFGAPVSKILKVELKSASNEPADGMEKMQLYGQEKEVYVARQPLLSNADIAGVSRGYDDRGQPQLLLDFTKEGAEKLMKFTTNPQGKMIGIVVHGKLMVTLNVNGPIGENAAISGGDFTQEDIDRMYFMMTATEIREKK